MIGPKIQKRILEIVVNAHSVLACTNQVQQGWGEDNITSVLFVEINKLWRLIKRPSSLYDLTPQPQFPVFPRPSKHGRSPTIDFVFMKGYIEQVYFAFECKIVDYANAALISEYVSNGMQRFIAGYYSSNMLTGGMIAYMFNSEVILTVNAINLRIKKQGNLGNSDCLNKDATLKGYDNLYKSNHRRTTDSNHFAIRHLFFSF